MAERLKRVAAWITAAEPRSPGDAKVHLGNGITSLTSCPTALYIALRHLSSPFDEMMQFIIKCGGDVDTIGAMAGALWGIANGAARLPSVDLEAREELLDVASRMFRRHATLPTAEQGTALSGASRRE